MGNTNMVTIMIGSSCDFDHRDTRESLIQVTSLSHSPGVKYFLFITVLKEMVSMEYKEQPGVAPEASPLLSLQSTNLFCVFHVSLPPPHKITRGGMYSRF
jgi:hypothetical protein